MKKKILYLFSDTGGGHRSAATAIINAVEHLKKGKYSQKMVDVFAECSGFLNVFAKLYGPVIKYSPQMWGRLYYWLDDEKKLEALEKMSGPFILEELTKLIKEEKPAVIISVHPMINHLTVKAIKQSGLKIPFVVVITDPVTLHRAWIKPEVDRAIVATPEARTAAIKYGMPEEKIKVCGMPIDPKFFLKDEEKEAARKKDRLKPKLFTILLMGGGEGGGKMYDLIEALSREKLKVQLIVIAGRNKKLETNLKSKIKKFNFPLRVYGFTDQVHELMAESDLIITKAGPGTIAEALAMGLPIIITSWLPGQEEGNVEFVVRENIGRVSKDPQRVVEIVKELQQPLEFAEIMKNIKRVSRPQAAVEIAREIFNYL
ncbi:MAG: glycosyltransferase [Candidatus Margulisbacteria bacterium]|nr:glycosyltransferase [Candidatus Margulisiibacteriota bacterium]